MDYVVVAAPAPQAPLSPKRVSSSSSSSSNIPEGYTCLTSSDGRKYYMHHASGRCSLPAPPAHSPCLLRMPGSIAAAAAAASRAAQGDVVCARDRASGRRGQGGRGGQCCGVCVADVCAAAGAVVGEWSAAAAGSRLLRCIVAAHGAAGCGVRVCILVAEGEIRIMLHMRESN